MRIAIVEDEALAANYLQKLLLTQDILPVAVGEITMLSSIKEATTFFFQNTVDLIFMDIHLGDGKSLEIFDKIAVKSPVVFITAYDNYAIEAFKQFAIGYILKPFDKDALDEVLLKYVTITKRLQEEQPSTLETATEAINTKLKDRFLIHDGHRLKSIETSEIAYLFASGKHLFLHTFQDERFIYDDTLKDVIEKLDAKTFFKINRSFIVNIHAIKEVIRHTSQKIELVLNVQSDDQYPIFVSKAHISNLKDWLS
ncbi:LytR/AlgR family response regulator transcription factor [Myroides fluvii]|uniref:LytR/AlgR family response regulator transcription factor n=1 Tax=Myroides fluvii TaxID=2572594 RepID=UPI00131B16A8|nr:LytTR family DNA-binding domain-containing protein [Myroides fluvii]